VKKKIVKILGVLTIAILLLLPCTPVLATVNTWYVDSDVVASGDGSSWAQAFKTIAEGTGAAGVGDTVMVGAGTYAENPWTGDLYGGRLYSIGAVSGSLTGEFTNPYSSNPIYVSASKLGAGTCIAGVALYQSSPGGTIPGDVGLYGDLYLSTDTNITSVALRIDVPPEMGDMVRELNLYYYTGGSWSEFSGYSVTSIADGYTRLSLTITAATSPSLSDLGGMPIGFGGDAGLPGSSAATSTLYLLIPTTFGIIAIVSLFFLLTGAFSVALLTTAIASGILAAIGISFLQAITS